MNAFCTLLSHKPKTDMPSLHPCDDVLLQNVHIRMNSSMGKSRVVVVHEGFDVIVVIKTSIEN